MPQPNLQQDIPELTALRIIAALCVVVSHLHGLGMVAAADAHRMLDGGRPAVAFFFVLSGFIMTHKYPRLHAGDHAATMRYAHSRLARLYPTLLLALCLALPTGIFMASTHAHDQLLEYYAIKDHAPYWLTASGLAQLLGLTGWVPAAAINQPWNSPAWSLSCEFFFYALFPFMRPAIQQQSTKVIITAVIVAWVLQGLWIVSIDAVIAPNRAGFLVYQFPLTHLFEFMLGIAAGVLVARLSRSQLNRLVIATTVVALSVLAAIHQVHSILPAYYGLSPLFVVLILGTVRASGSSWLAPLRQGLIVALGHASYALYMIHVPILVAASVLGFALHLGWVWLPVLMMASLVVHYGYAEPVRRFLMNRPTTRSLLA